MPACAASSSGGAPLTEIDEDEDDDKNLPNNIVLASVYVHGGVFKQGNTLGARTPHSVDHGNEWCITLLSTMAVAMEVAPDLTKRK